MIAHCFDIGGDETGQVLSLAQGETISVHLRAGQSINIRGRAGVVWASMERDPDDYVLEANERLRFKKAGLLVLEGLRETNEVELISPHA